MPNKKIGTIDISRLKHPPLAHEFLVAKILSQNGKNVIFIPPSNVPGNHKPDFIIDGKEYELKSPQGNSKRTIQTNIHRAMLQSDKIIIDLHRIKLNEENSIAKIKYEFEVRKKIKEILIITKKGIILEIKRK